MKEIDNLKASLPDMKKLKAIDPELKKLREEKKKIQAELDIVKELIDAKEGTISDVKQASQVVRNKHTEVKEAAEKY